MPRSSATERQAAEEVEAQRIAGLSQGSLLARLNSLAYLLDALAGYEAAVQEWWQQVGPVLCEAIGEPVK